MKNFLRYLVLMAVCSCIAQCKKSSPAIDTSLHTITLYDKPLDVIQAYIIGKWHSEYSKGGICANCSTNYHNDSVIIEFTKDNRIVTTVKGIVYVDTAITWIKQVSAGTGSNLVYVMHSYDRRGYPTNEIVQGIFNDSLVLKDFGDDPVSYYYSKSN